MAQLIIQIKGESEEAKNNMIEQFIQILKSNQNTNVIVNKKEYNIYLSGPKRNMEKINKKLWKFKKLCSIMNFNKRVWFETEVISEQ